MRINLFRTFLLAAIGITIVLPCTTAWAQKRLALVIGNDSYKSVYPLQKARNDARSVARLLREKLNFEVIEGIDQTRSDMSRSIASAISKLEAGDTVFFFFAGHGVEIKSENFLLPVDVPAAQDGQESEVKDASFAAADIIDRFHKKGARTVVAVLDACRNNPFAQPGGRGLGLGRGLASMDGATNTFIFFSAGAKQEARDRLSDDDNDPNSVFTRLFLRRLTQPNISLVELAKEVQKEVRDLAATVRHPQNPAYYDGIIGHIYLAGLTVTAEPAVTPAPLKDSAPVVLSQPVSLLVKSTGDGRNRFKLTELLEFESVLPKQEDCQDVGEKLLRQLSKEDGENVRFWVRAGPGDIGFCQKGQKNWFVEFYNRNLQDGLVIAIDKQN